MEWNIIDEGATDDDRPVVAREGDVDFKVEISFHELEIVAYVGGLKIVGQAHFGRSGRSSSQRSSDYLRHFTDDRLTLSEVRIYRHDTGALIDTASFTILNLGRVDMVYAREVGGEMTGDPALGAKVKGEPERDAPKGDAPPSGDAPA
jgi:hypothetical protein